MEDLEAAAAVVTAAVAVLEEVAPGSLAAAAVLEAVVAMEVKNK